MVNCQLKFNSPLKTACRNALSRESVTRCELTAAAMLLRNNFLCCRFCSNETRRNERDVSKQTALWPEFETGTQLKYGADSGQECMREHFQFVLRWFMLYDNDDLAHRVRTIRKAAKRSSTVSRLQLSCVDIGPYIKPLVIKNVRRVVLM